MVARFGRRGPCAEGELTQPLGALLIVGLARTFARFPDVSRYPGPLQHPDVWILLDRRGNLLLIIIEHEMINLLFGGACRRRLITFTPGELPA